MTEEQREAVETVRMVLEIIHPGRYKKALETLLLMVEGVASEDLNLPLYDLDHLPAR